MKCWIAVSVGILLALGTGCATTSDKRHVLLERTSAEVAYQLPPEQVMEAARAVLKERGYVLTASSAANSLLTQVKIVGNLDTISRWSMILVVGQRRGDGRFVVRAQEATWVTPGRADAHPGMASVNGPGKHGYEGTTDYVPGIPFSAAKPVFSRDLDVEWAILQHLEPQFAAHVEQEVDLYLASNHP